MKLSTLFSVAFAMINGALAGNKCTNSNGYYYCDAVNKFIYKNVGFSGSYEDVTSIGVTGNDAEYTIHDFSGPLSPFDEELSVHVRGPIVLHEFHVYFPSSSGSSQKRDVAAEEDCSTTQHAHHKHVKRATEVVTQTVFVNQKGELVTQSSEKSKSSVPTASSSATGSKSNNVGPGSASSKASSASSASSAPGTAGDWVRSSHYAPGIASNLTVLNNFGNYGVLSYANADNSGSVKEPMTLNSISLKSISELSLWSGLKCGDASEQYGCGYSRPGSVAMHAFAGAEKIMAFSFTMPSDKSTGSAVGTDMPAIWLLNARIPRIGQYLAESCWLSGCGELDLFEVLVNDYDKMVTALHDKQGGAGGGSGDYIERPSNGVMNAVVIFNKGEIHVQVVDSSFTFGSTLSLSQIESWMAVPGSEITIGA